MILLAIDVSRDENLRVTCHPDDRAMLTAALENMPVVIVESLKCNRGEWLMKLVPRFVALLLMVLCFGCAPRSELGGEKINPWYADLLYIAHAQSAFAEIEKTATTDEQREYAKRGLEHLAAFRSIAEENRKHFDEPKEGLVSPTPSAEGIAQNVVERWRNTLIEGLRLLRRGDANGREIIVGVLRDMYVATGTTAAPSVALPSSTQATLPPPTDDNANVRGVLKRKDEAFAEMNREDKK